MPNGPASTTALDHPACPSRSRLRDEDANSGVESVPVDCSIAAVASRSGAGRANRRSSTASLSTTNPLSPTADAVLTRRQSRRSVGSRTASGAARNQPDSGQADPVEEVSGPTDGGAGAVAAGPVANGVGNTHVRDEPADEPDGSRKRRRTDRSARSRLLSPPWKSRTADGPSFTFVEGRRRSSRVKPGLGAPTDSPPPCSSAGSFVEPGGELDMESVAKTGLNFDSVLVGKITDTVSSSPLPSVSSPTPDLALSPKSEEIVKETPRVRRSRRTSAAVVPDGPEVRASPLRISARVSRPSRSTATATATPAPTNRRRSTRLSAAADEAATPVPAAPVPEKRTIRIPAAALAAANATAAKAGAAADVPPVVVVKRPRLSLRMTLPEPKFLRPGARPAVKKYGSFAEWLEKDDPLQGDDDSKMQGAKFEKRVADILRLQDALTDDGILAGRNDILKNLTTGKAVEPPAVQDPARFYGTVHTHWDNVIAHSICLRRLMRRECRTHASEAKRLAAAVAAEVATNPKWSSRRVPVDEEEVWEREDRNQKQRYRQLVKDVAKMWDLVREEARREKLKLWEIERQEESKRALDSMLDRAKVLVERRQRGPGRPRVEPGDFGSEDDEMETGCDDDEDGEDDENEDEDDNLDSNSVTSQEGTRAAVKTNGHVDPGDTPEVSVDNPPPRFDFPPPGLEAGDGEDELDELDDDSFGDDDSGSSSSGDDDGVPDEDVEDDDEDEDEDEPATLQGLYSKYAPESTPKPEPEPADVRLESEPVTDAQLEPEMAHLTPRSSSPVERDCNQNAALVPVPDALLRGTLREYQHHGLDWLASLYSQNTNGILADEMGLGKTIQTISLLAHLAVHHHVWGPHLIVVPTSVMLNWEMEFKKWCPGFKILTYYGSRDERRKKRQGWMKDDMWNVVITSYQLIVHDALAFKKRSWHYLVLDEAHNIKNFQTQRWQTLLNFRTHSRLLLTGTPLQNNLSELWSLLFFLMPAGIDSEGGFAGLDQFISAMRKPADQILDQERSVLDAEAQQAVSKLHEVLRPYILRRLKADVEKQIPGKFEHVIICKLSKRQRQLYDEFLGRETTRRALASGNYMNIINCLMNLRKVCNHPDLFETRPIVTSLTLSRPAFADFATTDRLVRHCLLDRFESRNQLNLGFVGFDLGRREATSAADRMRPLSVRASERLETVVRQAQGRITAPKNNQLASLAESIDQITYGRQHGVLAQLRSAARTSRSKSDDGPVFGKGLVDKLTFGFQSRSFVRPREHKVDIEVLDDCEPVSVSPPECAISNLSLSLADRAGRMKPAVQRFAVVTPPVMVTEMAAAVLPPGVVSFGRDRRQMHLNAPFHEAQMRLSIAFPEKFLLQYDCGKLQTLDKLLRQLEAGGHRALIFTQMTRILDILEAFLNMHGHKYLRLDGSTKIEQRQLLTEQFNSDPRILCFILSSRSGGLGINLTGADTVIFYDLDWNPAMDKQCQDRCHRIGQTRDVHVYRLVSEYTIETNILKKSNQKRLLDDVIIQKGDFTTDYFNRVTYRDAMFGLTDSADQPDETNILDKVLDDVASGRRNNALALAEDQEDATAARIAQREMQQADLVDFTDQASSTAASTADTPTTATPAPADDGDGAVLESVAEDDVRAHVDDFMLRMAHEELKDVVVVPTGWNERKKKSRGGRGRGRRV